MSKQMSKRGRRRKGRVVVTAEMREASRRRRAEQRALAERNKRDRMADEWGERFLQRHGG